MVSIAQRSLSGVRASVWSIIGQAVAYLIVPLSIVQGQVFPAGVQIIIAPIYIVAAIGLAAAASGRRMNSTVTAVGYVLLTCYIVLFAIELVNGDLVSYPRPLNFDFLAMYFILVAFPFFVLGLRAVGCEIGRFEITMAATIIVATAWSVFELATGSHPSEGINGLNSNTFGMAVSVWTLFLFAKALGEKNINTRWLAVSLTGLIPIVLSGSRLVWAHTLLAFAALFFWWAFSWKRWRILGAAAAASIAAALVLFLNRFVQQRIVDFSVDLAATFGAGDMTGSSVGIRAAMAISGFRAFLERPWFGYGLSEVKAAALLHRPDQAPDFINMVHLHNQYITHMVAFGIFGLLFTLVIFALFLFAASRSDNPFVRRFGFVVTGVLAFDMLAEMWFHGGVSYGVMFLLLGLILLTANEGSPAAIRTTTPEPTAGAT